ncbi:mandelate racemase/muconate lactonizing protein [Candidatus Halobonum tyrrellensis G22]|uniref:Mandelate racemase/muconate lactonizing protein n=1 Tax=Candidatus Halobonum tyrrellensis G22 TaxID=1324957 RepID=V4HGY9_9EURY|nr:mandelate racemase [Candidatus Halobonum tyrrellensis]ESP87104.1 mandelate racemase/muconate lactonizing protein [Candidatus Halobonum tyrrellensis G22]
MVEEDVLEPGRIAVPDDPGLGVELDLDTVEAHLKEGEELFDPA